MTLTWGEILSDPTLNNLAKRLNRKYLYMGEEDIQLIINECLNAAKIMERRNK